MSGTIAVIPIAGAKSAKSGKVQRSISPGSIAKSVRICSTWALKMAWVYTAPFGGPVLPLVNKIAASSSAAGDSVASVASSPRSKRLPAGQSHIIEGLHTEPATTQSARVPRG